MSANADSAGPTIGLTEAGLDEILLRHGSEFAESACAAFFGRSATPDEIRLVGVRLARGDAKMRILCDLQSSIAEPGARTAPSGFRIAKFKFRLACLPLVGGLLRALMGVEADTVLDRRTRALEELMRERLEGLSLRLEAVRVRLAAPIRTGSGRSSDVPRALEQQRALLRAEHAIDRKVWAIEQAEAKTYIASILEWARNSETYAKSLEKEVVRLRDVFNEESAKWLVERESVMRKVDELEARLALNRGPES